MPLTGGVEVACQHDRDPTYSRTRLQRGLGSPSPLALMARPVPCPGPFARRVAAFAGLARPGPKTSDTSAKPLQRELASFVKIPVIEEPSRGGYRTAQGGRCQFAAIPPSHRR